MKRKLFDRSALCLDGTKLLLAAALVSLILIPFGRMAAGITSGDFQKVVSSSSFVPAVKNSLKIASVTTVISVTLGFTLAVCLQRTAIRGKGFLSIFLILPMLVPSISHATGLVVLFGTNGVLTNLLHLPGAIYGFGGAVAGSVLYSYPMAFLLFNDALHYEDSSPYEAAKVLGVPLWRQFTSITLPFLRIPLISAVFSVFALVMTDYGVPLRVGGKTTTLAVLMYQQVMSQMDFGKGSVIGLFLLIPAAVAFIFNAITKRNAKLSYVTKPFDLHREPLRDRAAAVFCALVALAIAALFLALGVFAFATRYPRDMRPTLNHLLTALRMNGLRYLKNSLRISVVVAFLGMSLTFLTAYMTARVPSRTSLFLHLMGMTSMAIPGLVLGLAYVLTFKGTFIYGTMAILILVNTVHFFASPYLMFYNSLSKMNGNLESVGLTLGIGRVRMVWSVIIPQSKATFFEAFSFFFVNSMMTISAVTFLFSFSTKPLSLLINQFEDAAQVECAAVVTLMILAVNLLMKVAVLWLKKRAEARPASVSDPNM